MMKGRISFHVIFAFFMIGCATGDFLGDFNFISPSEEKQLGLQLSKEIAKQSHELNQAIVTRYVQSLGQLLVSVSLHPNDTYTFHVIEDPSVNAFAIPGGHLYVHTGLIAAADNEAELASVMGHELGHAESRHPTQSLSRAIGAQMIMGMILGENPGRMQQLAAGLLTNGGISAYSRSAEREADSIAVYLLNRAGYDPYYMVTFLEKLIAIEQQEGRGSVGVSLFSSHPATTERIQAVRALIDSFGDQRARNVERIGGFAPVKREVLSLMKTKPRRQT